MKAIQLRPHQVKAIDAIREAISLGQKHMVIEMPIQSGKGIVLAKTVEDLDRLKKGKILIVTSKTIIKEQIEDDLFKHDYNFVRVDKNNVTVETEQKILKHPSDKNYECSFVVFFDVAVLEGVYEALICKDKTVLVFTTNNTTKSRRLFKPDNVVFSYSYKDAVKDGILTPAMDSRAFGPAVELFTKRLLEQFECVPIQFYSHTQDQGWDLVVQKHEYKIWVDCKTYKSQVVSPSAANSLLSNIVLRKIKQNISERDFVLLLVFSKIPSFQKDEIFRRYRIIVWDIENLVFYSKDDPNLLKQLAVILECAECCSNWRWRWQ